MRLICFRILPVPRQRSAPAWALGLLTVAVLSGCGGGVSDAAGSTTCFAFGELSLTERTALLAELLVEAGLDPHAQGNELGIRTAVDDFCGSATVPLSGASRNLDEPILKAVDWDAESW